MSGFEAIRMVEVELSKPLPALPRREPGTDRDHARARSLVRLHGRPLGLIDLVLGPEGINAERYADTIRESLGTAIEDHLRADGLPRSEGLTAAGMAPEGTPACEARLDELRDTAPTVSVIIPTRDRPDRLRTCLDSILATDYPAARREIVVVDNAPSTSGTLDLVRDEYADRPDVRYVREDNPGSASARNQGLVMAGGELIAFTDDDVVVDSRWLVELVGAFARDPDAACVSGLLLPYELESQAQVWFEEYGGFSRGFERRRYNLTDDRLDSVLYPYSAGVFGTGNNMSFRAEVLRQIGGFDPALGNGTPALGGVDSEALLRTVLEGHTVLYEPAAIVHHVHRADYEALRKQVYSYGVGLTAYLLKTLLSKPQLIPDFARRVPAGLRFALDPGSQKNEEKQGGYPAELTKLELKGMVFGPLAYLRSRREFGQHRRAATAPAGALVPGAGTTPPRS